MTQNIKNCPKFDYCSINICPLDEGAHLRNMLPGENRCPFTINKKHRGQKGMRTIMPAHLLQFVPKSNIKMLNKRNKKFWQEKETISK